jgi:hypothetical protein
LSLFTKEEAIARIEPLISRVPRQIPVFDLGRVGIDEEREREALGPVLANAVLPELEVGDLGGEVVTRILEMQSTNGSVVIAFPEIARIAPEFEARAVSGILRAITGAEDNGCGLGFSAIRRWVQFSKDQRLPPLPRHLLDGVISVVLTRREPGLVAALRLCCLLIREKLLASDDLDRLSDALGHILTETSYHGEIRNGLVSITNLTLVRGAAVQLANQLNSAGTDTQNVRAWLDAAPLDPMPEVRFSFLETGLE